MTHFTKRWMSFIPGNKRLTDLTIPGTHDSGTYPAYYSSFLTKCQSLNFTQQLEAGIRFLDVRLDMRMLGPHDHTLWIWHGVADMNINFKGVIEQCKKFLAENPMETIFMSIALEKKNPDAGEINEFYTDLVQHHLSAYPGLFYTQHKIPSLSEVRGKVVLIRRFATGKHPGIGLNLRDHWPGDGMQEFTNNAIRFYVQDKFDKWKSNVPDKFNKYVQPTLDAAAPGSDTLYFNFSSGTSGNISYSAYGPQGLAGIINPLMLNYIRDKEKTRYGIVAMDFPEVPDSGALIDLLVSCNPFDFIPGDYPRHGDVVEIRPRLHLNKCADVKGNATKNGTGIIVHASNDQPNQRWRLEDTGEGDGFFYLKAENTHNSVLDVSGANKNPGAAIILQEQNKGNHQRWKLLKIEKNGYYILIPKHAPYNTALALDNGNVMLGTLSNSMWSIQWAVIRR